MKPTPWYTGDQKPMPDRVGPYERDYKYGQRYYYCWWDGKNFGTGLPVVNECADIRMEFGASPRQNLPWRGVAK